MTEFLSGRKIDKPVRGLMNYIGQRVEDYPKEVVQGWKNALGMGTPVPIGSMDQPVAESVGGLSILPAVARKQVVEGMKSILKGQTNPEVIKKFTNRAENIGKEFDFLPQNAIDPITEIQMVKKLSRTSTGAKKPIGRAISKPGGKTEFQLTHKIPSKDVVHEVAHAYDTKMVASTKNTYRSGHAKLIKEMTDIANRGAARYTAIQKKAGMADGVRYSAYQNVNPREILARNVNDRVRLAKLNQKKPLTQKQWRNIYKNSQEATLKLIEEKAPKLLSKGIESVKKKYVVTADSIKRRPLTDNEKIDAIFGFAADTGKRFPNSVRSPEAATKLGEEFSIKELNRVMLKERGLSGELAKKQEWDKAQNHALRSQGAREALESKFVSSQGKVYDPSTGFKPKEFDSWLKQNLKETKRGLPMSTKDLLKSIKKPI